MVGYEVGPTAKGSSAYYGDRNIAAWCSIFFKQQSNEGIGTVHQKRKVSLLQIYMIRLSLEDLLKLHNELGDIISHQPIMYSKYNADYI